MHGKIQDVIRELGSELTLASEPENEFQAWSSSYFRNHRKRYMSDIELVRRYYSGGRVLELGSAPFHFTAILEKMGLPVTGVDIDPARFAGFIDRQKLKVVRCDVETEPLPFADGSFHLVLFNEVFEHMRINPIETLEKIRRVLHPDGHLILSTPNLYSVTTYINFLLGRGFDDPYEQFSRLREYGHMGHVREYSVSQMRKFLDRTGFRVVEVRMQSHRPLRGLWTPFNLVRKAVPRLHAYQTLVAAI